MKKDIEFPKVENVGIWAPPDEQDGAKAWKVHIINLLDEPITNVLVNTRGYGTINKEEIKTSQLRHYFEAIEPHGERGIELIPSDLVGLNNQYWVSYYVNGQIFDKKFIFLPDSLIDKNMTPLPVLETPGILII